MNRTSLLSGGAKFAEDLLNHIRERMKEFQKETGNLYNLEATPCRRVLLTDSLEKMLSVIRTLFRQVSPGQNYYTNSSQLPSWYTQDLFRALKMQDNLQTRYTGGTVFHMYMNEAISSPRPAATSYARCSPTSRCPTSR